MDKTISIVYDFIIFHFARVKYFSSYYQNVLERNKEENVLSLFKFQAIFLKLNQWIGIFYYSPYSPIDGVSDDDDELDAFAHVVDFGGDVTRDEIRRRFLDRQLAVQGRWHQLSGEGKGREGSW